jgi:hypothetical protein
MSTFDLIHKIGYRKALKRRPETAFRNHDNVDRDVLIKRDVKAFENAYPTSRVKEQSTFEKHLNRFYDI